MGGSRRWSSRTPGNWRWWWWQGLENAMAQARRFCDDDQRHSGSTLTLFGLDSCQYMYGRARVILRCRVNGEEERKKRKKKNRRSVSRYRSLRRETRIPRVVTKCAILGGLHFTVR